MMRFKAILAVIIFCFGVNTAYSQSGSGGSSETESSSRNTDSRSLVRQTKKLLYELNYDIGRINNVLDQKARIAIRKVQRKLDMEVDGRVSRALVEILSKANKPKTWGAIAATPRGSYGASWNYKTRREAERRALEGCRKNSSGKRCNKVLTATKSSCIALVTYKHRGRRGYVSRTRRSLKLAMNSAMASCKQKLRSKSACNIRTYICADGSHK